MILLDDVVKVLDLVQLNRHDSIFFSPVYGRFVGVTLVHSGLLQTPVLAYRLFENCLTAAVLRLARSRMAVLVPSLSTAQYKYCH
jgi:hypothetical protein